MGHYWGKSWIKKEEGVYPSHGNIGLLVPWLGEEDSNLHSGIQIPESCHWTIPECILLNTESKDYYYYY